LLLCLPLAGCWQAPAFRPNTEGRDPAGIDAARARAIAEATAALFGTPDEPKLPPGTGLRLELLRVAAGPTASDAEGNGRGLFRRHCVTCHGISGDGAGPSAAVLVPYPRDYRDGLFKYTSTAGGAKPARADLERTLRRGIPGTAMPSFHALADAEFDALVEYVEYLSIRGQTESYLAGQVLDDEEPLPLDLNVVRQEGAGPAAEGWRRAEAMVVSASPLCDTPQQAAARIARGRTLFHERDSRCVQCHGAEGRGDGPQSGELYDDWNKPKLAVADAARRFRLPPQRLRPRNFTEGIFHGGDRPLDIYWRICVGIKGTPMPAFGPGPGSGGVLRAEEIWDLVAYVRSLAKPAAPAPPGSAPSSPMKREESRSSPYKRIRNPACS
jgi:mono/diheme cytochrome c family protein